MGHAAVFDQWTTLYEGRFLIWREIVRKGAFARAIAEAQDVRALFNHDSNFVLGRSAAGTLRIAEDAAGLVAEIDPPDTQLVRDLVLTPIGRGDVSGMSFAFRPQSDGGERTTIRTEGDREIRERELLDVDLFDVSPVTDPAYAQTDVALRALGERRERELITAIQGRRTRRHLDRAGMRLRLLGAGLTR